MPKNQLTADDSNRVTIYVWKMNLAMNRVGHASLKTFTGGPHGNGIYASFWPNQITIQQKFLSGVNSANIPNLQTDILNEDNCQPDVTISLYSLDVNKVNQAYSKFRTSNCNWSIWGSSFFKDDETRNCSGLVAFLLNEGGLTNLVPASKFNLDESTGTIKNALESMAIPLVLGNIATGNKIEFGVAKATMSTKVTLLTTAVAFLKNSALTPNDVATLVNEASKAEHQQYDIVNEDAQNYGSKKFCQIL